MNASAQETRSGAMITRVSDVPAFSIMLTGGHDAIIPLPEHERTSLGAIKTGENEAVILATSEARVHRGGIQIHSLLSRLKAHSFQVVGIRNITTEVLASVYEMREAANDEQNFFIEESDAERSFDRLIQRALELNASDVHFWITRGMTRVRYRVNGELTTVAEMSRSQGERLAQCAYNALAEQGTKQTAWNANEMQDAQIVRNYDDTEVRIRYAHDRCHPEGVHVALRLLAITHVDTADLSAPKFDMIGELKKLGYTSAQIEMMRVMISRPSGVVVFAGTTGSGKSTTMSTLLRGIISDSRGRLSIITVEDPPEYDIPGALQTPVVRPKSRDEAKAENPFVAAIKSTMRRDPDILMIGEVRDGKTASAMASAVQSGHPVITTVHASSAIGIIARLENVGASESPNPMRRDVLAAPDFLAGLIHQTLLPVLCPHCSIPVEEAQDRIDPALYKRLLRCANIGVDKVRVRGDGCAHCNDMAVVGRTVAAEVVMPDHRMLEFIRKGADHEALTHWRKAGAKGVGTGGERSIGVSRLDHAVLKMRQGLIAPEDVELRCGRLTMEAVLEDGIMQETEVQELVGHG